MLNNAKKYKTIVSNANKEQFIVCNVRVDFKQNRFKNIVFVKQDIVSNNYRNFKDQIKSN